jgi:uncharacterized protein YbaA (DUF1428 family)
LAKYVDGFVFVVPKDKVEEYQKMAEQGRDMWMKYGALEYMECVGEDLEPKEMGGMKPLSFRELTKAQPNDTVWFSFIVYESKEQRDEINAKVMEKGMKQTGENKDVSMPFDMKRFSVGGFIVKVEG